MKAAHLLAGDDLSADVALLDEQRVRPHVFHLKREHLLRHAEALVGDQRHERGRVALAFGE